jgi:hypothetical protein
MVKKKIPATRWHDGSTPIEELPAAEQMAHQLVSERADLTPSVVRIMDAELTEDQRTHALNAFNVSLDNPGDPNRDPRTAIANALVAA